MILLTGATSAVGGALLRRLTEAGSEVRCIVGDPRQLGSDRVRVQLVLGDLSNPHTFRHAMRGVETVIHLADATRDRDGYTIEEVTGVATWGLLRAAERASVGRLLFLSALGASPLSQSRFLCAKALAEDVVACAEIDHTVLAPSLMYAPGRGWLGALERHAKALPFIPVPVSRRARVQPIWADDVADCFMSALAAPKKKRLERYELAGPQTFSYREMVTVALKGLGINRPVVNLPFAAASRIIRVSGLFDAARVPVVKDEVEMMHEAMLAEDGSSDAEDLGVIPHTLAEVVEAARDADATARRSATAVAAPTA